MTTQDQLKKLITQSPKAIQVHILKLEARNRLSDGKIKRLESALQKIGDLAKNAN